MNFFESGIQHFRSQLIGWFREEGKSYPWRDTEDPYAILVSELMLQQTRIQTVLDRRYFENWLEKFPGPAVLAGAGEAEILKAWEGLGYYNRARNLQKAARIIVEDHGGVFPTELEDIRRLPGVGRYTAGAVYSFAYGKRAPIVDGNVVRVLSRLFAYAEPVDKPAGLRQMWDWAEKMTPEQDARDYNSAIMELGQQLCLRAHPRCGECPVAEWCLAGTREIPEMFPVKSGKSSVTRKEEHVLLLVDGDRVFLVQESGNRRKGLWKLPACPGGEASRLPVVLETAYSITRYRVDLVVHRPGEGLRNDLPPGFFDEGEWFVCPSAGGELPPMGAPYRKVLAETIEKSNIHKGDNSG